MAKLSQAKLEWYRKSLSKQGNEASKFVEKSLSNILKTDGIGDIRNESIELIKNTVGVYGDNAKVLSCQMFDDVMQLENAGKTAEFFDGLIDDNYIEKNIRYKVQKVIDGNAKAYVKDLKDMAYYLVQRSAYENMKENCVRQKVKYALVPSGLETCAFCYMLASRGFVYSTKVAENRGMSGFHPHCDCKLIPSNDGKLKVSGYNRDRYYNIYKEARENADSQNASGIVKSINEMADDKGWDYMWGNKGE